MQHLEGNALAKEKKILLKTKLRKDVLQTFTGNISFHKCCRYQIL